MSWLKKLFGGLTQPADQELAATDLKRVKLALDPDDYHARYVGVADDGRQFFLTHPFEPATGELVGCEYLALYTFSQDGSLLDAQIDDLGPRSTVDPQAVEGLVSERLAELGNWQASRIEVFPFNIDRNGTSFGLIYRAVDDEDDVPAVEAMPGNYMAFFEPWDSGVYDT